MMVHVFLCKETLEGFYTSLVSKRTNTFQCCHPYYIYFDRCIVKLCFSAWNIWCSTYICNNCNSTVIFQCVSVVNSIINVFFFKKNVCACKTFWNISISELQHLCWDDSGSESWSTEVIGLHLVVRNRQNYFFHEWETKLHDECKEKYEVQCQQNMA